jgi:iron(II)-dependent oxidoreductase
LRRASVPAVLFAVGAVGVAGCVQSRVAERGAGEIGTDCASIPVPNDPLLAGLRLKERDEITRAADEGLVVVQYVAVGCAVHLAVMSDCRAAGSYSYRAAKSRARQVMADERALLEKLPIAGREIADALIQLGGIRLDEEVVGRLEAERESGSTSPSGTGCDGATHIVSASDLGGSALSAGAAKTLEEKSSLFDERSRDASGLKIIEQMGDARSCVKAIRRGERTPGCDVPLRLRLSPIAPVASVPKEGGPAIALAAGDFWMGADGLEKNQAPRHKVYLDAFRIDRMEVTAFAYAACVSQGLCSAPRTGGACTYGDRARESHPINCVGWTQAKAYCAFAKGRLPTEAEWERAARGPTPRAFVWGDEWPPPAGAGNFADATAHGTHPAWLAIDGYDDGFSETSPVGSFPKGASSAGALDMAGNVLEWTADYYADHFYQRSPAKNPKGPTGGEARVVRGGSYGHHRQQQLAVTVRFSYAENVSSEHIGFRCAY